MSIHTLLGAVFAVVSSGSALAQSVPSPIEQRPEPEPNAEPDPTPSSTAPSRAPMPTSLPVITDAQMLSRGLTLEPRRYRLWSLMWVAGLHVMATAIIGGPVNAAQSTEGDENLGTFFAGVGLAGALLFVTGLVGQQVGKLRYLRRRAERWQTAQAAPLTPFAW